MFRPAQCGRRSWLRGAGGAAIALPLLPEVVRAAADPPVRVVTLFFGLGLDPSWQRDFSGPLEPYQNLSSKLALTSVSLEQASGGAHCETSPVVFVGEKAINENRSGGASIDQLIRGQLDATAPVLVSGLWWRRGACDAQALRVWNADGTARLPIKRPSKVFEQLFGALGPTPDDGSDPDANRKQRLRRSVLDAVLGEYESLRGPNSYLGTESKQKVERHLNTIREIEKELAPADGMVTEPPSCEVPARPVDPDIADYDRFTYGTGGSAPQIAWQDVAKVFRMHADLWVLGLECDLVRYGNLMFESAGGHMNLTGNYAALGESTSFPGTSQHDSYFHDNQRTDARLYQHFAQTNLAYFLSELNARTEGNGASLLDNTTVVIGTEYGWNHNKSGVFHAIAGGGGRFRSGNFTDRAVNAVDVYNAVARAHGVSAQIGNKTGVDSGGDASFLLA